MRTEQSWKLEMTAILQGHSPDPYQNYMDHIGKNSFPEPLEPEELKVVRMLRARIPGMNRRRAMARRIPELSGLNI